MTRIDVTSDRAVVAVCDASVTLPSNTDQNALVRELEALVGAGRVFYLITDDPVSYGIEISAGEPLAPPVDQEFEPAGGSFGLELETGTIAVYGWNRDGSPVLAGTTPSAQGAHVVSVFTRRPFDGPRHAAHMARLLGPDWTYTDRVNKLGVAGCLPLVLIAIALVAQQWRFLWFILPLLAVSWLPFLILRRTRRYREAERRMKTETDRWPHFALKVLPTTQPALAGGFLRV